MNPFDPELQSLAWALIHFLWQGCVIWLLMALALRGTRGARPQVRYALGIVGLALCLVVPVGTYLKLRPATFERASHQAMASPSDRRTEAPIHPAPALVPKQLLGIATQVDDSTRMYLPWVIQAWFLGSLLLAIRLGGGWIGLQVMRRKAHPATTEWRQCLDRMSRAFGLWCTPRFLVVQHLASPVVVGWVRPMLLMPLGLLSGLDPTAVEALLAHELAHIRRHDYLVNLMQCVVEILLFYHPAIWWISRRVRSERELCCDDVAVAWCSDAQLYAETLNRLHELRSRSLAPAMAAGGGELMFRIKRLLLPSTVQNTRRINALALGCSMAMLLGAGFTTRLLQAENASLSPAGAWFLAGSSPKDYQLSEDARVAFEGRPSLRLSSDQIQAPTGAVFGTAMQMRLPDGFLGKRVRFGAWVRTENVKDWAGLWMRVDGQENKAPLGFDNMMDRPIRGSQDWKRAEIVLDVPADARNLAYGILLTGNGRVWIADARLELADATAVVTGGPYKTAPSVFDPENWRLIGTQPKLYALRQDPENSFQGSPSTLVESNGEAIEDFGGFNQILNAHVFAGKRVRFSAWMKTRDVTRRAGLWMTITGKMNGLVRSIAGDNMENRPVKGTTDWQRYEVVVDIAPEAQDLCLGALITGTGKVWISHPTLEVVNTSVPSTNTLK